MLEFIVVINKRSLNFGVRCKRLRTLRLAECQRKGRLAALKNLRIDDKRRKLDVASQLFETRQRNPLADSLVNHHSCYGVLSSNAAQFLESP